MYIRLELCNHVCVCEIRASIRESEHVNQLCESCESVWNQGMWVMWIRMESDHHGIRVYVCGLCEWCMTLCNGESTAQVFLLDWMLDNNNASVKEQLWLMLWVVGRVVGWSRGLEPLCWTWSEQDIHQVFMRDNSLFYSRTILLGRQWSGGCDSCRSEEVCKAYVVTWLQQSSADNVYIKHSILSTKCWPNTPLHFTVVSQCPLFFPRCVEDI